MAPLDRSVKEFASMLLKSPSLFVQGIEEPLFQRRPRCGLCAQAAFPHARRTEAVGTQVHREAKRRTREIESILNWPNVNLELAIFKSGSYWFTRIEKMFFIPSKKEWAKNSWVYQKSLHIVHMKLWLCASVAGTLGWWQHLISSQLKSYFSAGGY